MLLPNTRVELTSENWLASPVAFSVPSLRWAAAHAQR